MRKAVRRNAVPLLLSNNDPLVIPIIGFIFEF